MKILFILLSFLSLSISYILPDINLTIPNASQFTTFFGAGTNYFFSYTLSDFGDINGDGIDDAIIGSPSVNNAVPGIVYIIFGHKNGIPNLDLSTPINNTQGFMIVGQAGMGCFGCSVGKAGDFNGDGVEDIAIGSPSQGTGAVYIIFGVRGITTNLYIPGDLPGRGFVISGAQSAGFFGLPVANAGDVNGDGLQDVIIGAYTETYNGPASGSVYVIFGRKTGITDFTAPNDLTSDLGFYVRGKQYDSLGISANGAGDFNGDGIDDIIMGAYAAQLPYRSDPGYAYIIFGRKTGFPNYDLAAGIGISEVSQIRGFASLNYFGYSVSKAGDVNNDGVDDIAVGAVGYNCVGKTGCGAAYVIFGRKYSGVFNMDLVNGLSDTEGFAIYGANSGDALGYKVSNVGDINGDTIDDVAVSGYTAALPGKANAGAVYVIYGRKTGISDIDLASGLNNNALGFQIQGTSALSYLGFALSDAGDVNADGAPDLLIGAYGNQNPAGIKAGSAFIVYGVPAPANTFEKATEILTQVQSAGALANEAAAIVLFFAKINNGLPLLFCFLVEMLYYVRYLKIVYPPKLQYLLEQPDPDFLSIPNISSAPEELVDYLPNYTIPVKFEYYGFYSSFLINFWPSIVMILIVGVIIIVALVLDYATKSKKWINEKCLKLKQSLKWNYLIAMFTGYYSDIALQTFLEMRQVKFGSFLEGLSFITCLSMNFTAVFVLVKMYLVLRKLKLAKQQTRKTNPSNSQDYEALKVKLKDFEVIFNSYKEDSFAQQCYLLLYSLRFYIFYSIVAYLFAYPVVQTSLISVMGAASLIYLGVKRPFTDKKELVMALIQETILQIVNISAFVLAVTDKGANQTDRLRVAFGDIIIGCNVAFVLVGIFYSVIMLVLMFRDFYHSLKKKIKNKELHVKECRTTTTQAAIVQPPFISRPEIDITSLNESQHNLNTPSFITNYTVHHQFNELMLPEPAVSNSTSNVNSLNPFVGVNRRQQRMRMDSHFSLGGQDNTIQEINEKSTEQQDILITGNDKPLASNEGQVLENNSNIVICNNNPEVRGRIKALGLFYRREQALRKV